MATIRLTNRPADTQAPDSVLGGMTMLVLEIVVPLALTYLVEALTILGYLPEFAVLDLPLYAWAMAGCAAWVLVVLNCGPFLATGSSKRKGTA